MGQARSYDLEGSVRNVECSSTKRWHHELHFPKIPNEIVNPPRSMRWGISANQDNTWD
jgi:hypothetical protein